MVNFFESIISAAKMAIEYLSSVVTSVIVFIQMISQSGIVIGSLVGFLPEIIQVSGMAVLSIAVIKAIFGRQGSS